MWRLLAGSRILLGLALAMKASTRRTRSRDAVLVLCLAAASCRRGDSSGTRPDPSAGPAQPLAAPASSVPLTVADVIRSWDDAHNRHDIDALRQIYGNEVDFYGRRLSRDAVLATKADAFRRSPDFSQRLSDLKTSDAGHGTVATFTKKWVANGKTRGVEASVEIAPIDGRLLVVKETDASVSSNGGNKGCKDAVEELASATGPAKELLATDQPPKWLNASDQPTEANRYLVGLYDVMPTHMSALAWFEVDGDSGHIRETMPDAVDLQGAPQLMSKVVSACRKPGAPGLRCCFNGHGASAWGCVDPSVCWTTQPTYESNPDNTCDPRQANPCATR